MVGANQSTIKRWETGESRLSEVRKGDLARVLDVPYGFFSGESVPERLLSGVGTALAESTPDGENGSRGDRGNHSSAGLSSNNGGFAADRVRNAPVLSPNDIVRVARGEIEPREARRLETMWHNQAGKVVATVHPGPPFGLIQPGFRLLVRLEPDEIEDGRLYLVSTNGHFQIRRTRCQSGNANLNPETVVGELLEVRVPRDFL
jgi:hypothetical protein